MNGQTSPPLSRPIIVTGVARGGTSLIASICHHLGIPMGRGGPRYENRYLQRAVLANRWDVVSLLLAEIRVAQPLWGWKLPALVNNLPRVEALIPDARYLFVFKDVVSVARRKASTNGDMARIIGNAVRSYRNVTDFVAASRPPCMLLSYEAIASDMPHWIREIARFCEIGADDPQAVAARVNLDAEAYRGAVRQSLPWTDLDERLRAICREHGVKMPVLGKSKPEGRIG